MKRLFYTSITKIITLLLITTALTACSFSSEFPQEEQKQTNQEEGQIFRVTKESCDKMQFKLQREECLFDYVRSNLYGDEEASMDDLDICKSLEERPLDRDECFWLFAMKTRKRAYCDFIANAVTDMDSKDSKTHYYDYLTVEYCKSSLTHNYEDASWKLVYGIPPYADPEPLEYEGTAILEGWIVEEPVYVGEPEKQFKVRSKDLKKLPAPFQDNEIYQIYEYSSEDGYTKVDPEIISTLDAYSKNHPAKIKITALRSLMEGTPFLELDEIIE